MYLGGNGFYWVTAVDPERPHVIEVRRWRGTRDLGGGARRVPPEHDRASWAACGGTATARPRSGSASASPSQGNDARPALRRQPGSYDPRAAFIFEGVGGRGDRRLPVADARQAPPATRSTAPTRPRHAAARAGAGLRRRLLRRLPARGRGASRSRTSSRAAPSNPLVRADIVYLREAERRRGLLGRLDRLVLGAFLQRLRQQRLAHHRERAAPLCRGRAPDWQRRRARRLIVLGW